MKAKKPSIALGEPGTTLASFTVPGRAVPWKAPTTTRTGHAYKDPKLVAWQDEVYLRAAMARKDKPYQGAVRVWLHVYLKRKSGAAPDVTNLAKAIEDSLQGAVFTNDRQVEQISIVRVFEENERVVIMVEAA